MYDVIVIGAGHAGVEASLASARRNKKTLLLCGNVNKIANMPCNPSVGGPAKGIWCGKSMPWAGNGQSGRLDSASVQMLNLSKARP